MNFFRRALLVAVTAGLVVVPAMVASASASVSYDFNTEGDLDANFNSYVQSGTITQGSSGGINNTADVDIAGTANGVFATKTSYSIGPVGSTYVFTAFMRSVGNGGYSGMGFTSLTPSAGSAGGNPYRPTDALGISVHGGGFVFHDGSGNYNGNWNGAGNDAAITTVQVGSPGDLLNSGSPDKWYKVVFTAVRDSSTTFDTEVKVWPVLSDGSLINSSPSAIFQFNNRPATTIIGAPKISSYFNLSGDRVYDFDNFQVDISGGASIIEEGYAVVLTDSALNDYGTIAMDGNVADNGGQTVTERGFVYGSSADPTISGDKVVVTGSNGTYSASTGVLSDGTYHVRAYATNSNGTSYGTDIQVTVDAASTEVTGGGGGSGSGGGSGGSGGANQSGELAATGSPFDVTVLVALGVALIALGAVARRRVRR